MISELVETVNGSRLFAGIMMLLLNIGSRFVMEDLSKSQEEWFNNQILRRLVIFAICFVATKDLVLSVILSSGFIIFSEGIMNRNGHPMSVLPKRATPPADKNDPFGFLRISVPGLAPVQNPAADMDAPVIFTT